MRVYNVRIARGQAKHKLEVCYSEFHKSGLFVWRVVKYKKKKKKKNTEQQTSNLSIVWCRSPVEHVSGLEGPTSSIDQSSSAAFLKGQCHDIQWFFALFFCASKKMAAAHASVADIRPWKFSQPCEQLRRPRWVEQMSFSAALPGGRHYFSPHKMAEKITDYRYTAA